LLPNHQPNFNATEQTIAMFYGGTEGHTTQEVIQEENSGDEDESFGL